MDNTESGIEGIEGTGIEGIEGTGIEGTGIEGIGNHTEFGNPPRKRRGRPPKNGTGNGEVREKTTKAPLATRQQKVKQKANLIRSIHAYAATFASMRESTAHLAPYLLIEDSESELLADSLQNVADFYPVIIDPKMQAWLNLAVCIGMVYGGKYMTYRNNNP